MDKEHYEEMCMNLKNIMLTHNIREKIIYLFGHCNATEELVDLLMQNGLRVKAILDNNVSKYDFVYRGISVVSPKKIISEDALQTIVCVVARAYEPMKEQLRELGFTGPVVKLVDYNSYSEYSLSDDTLKRKKLRVERGIMIKEKLEKKYPNSYKILCPFSALGDVF